MTTIKIVFRPAIDTTGPPGDGQLTQLMRNLVEAGKLDQNDDRLVALQTAQEALLKAGFSEEQVFKVTHYILVASHPGEFADRRLPETFTMEVRDGVLVSA